jgi:hypothetical protein
LLLFVFKKRENVMKNIVKVLGLAAVFAVAGCASHGDNCRSCNRREPAPVAYAQPVAYQGCGAISCGERTVREPVEVVYRRTTYKTVYEPKTTSSVSYEREAYRGCGANCAGAVEGGTAVYY